MYYVLRNYQLPLLCIPIRNAHFPTGNQETGNQSPGNFLEEIEYQEKPGKPGKIVYFERQNN